MSGPLPGPGAPGSRSVSVSNAPPSAGMPQQQMPPQQTVAPAAAPQSSQNLNQIVLEYLNKKGYNRTEAMLRKESAQQDSGRAPVDETGYLKYQRAYDLLRMWIDGNIDLYQPELKSLLWPVFVYSFLALASDFYQEDSKRFFEHYKEPFNRSHAEDMRQLEAIRTTEHVSENRTAKIYRDNKYRLSLTNMAFNSLLQFLESREREGGAVIMGILQIHMNIITYERATVGPERSIQALRLGTGFEDDLPAEDEGIPGHQPGSANTDRNAPSQLARLTLGQMPLEQELQEDVRAQLEEEDSKNPARAGQNSLIDEFEQRIKREPTDDVPNRETVPLPPSVARDVAMEVQKVIEHRDRFKIASRTGGVGSGVSVTMFTFHNTFDNINCIDFSGDNALVAVGTAESYIRVWSLDGTALPEMPGSASAPSASKRLYGHAAPVYAVSFSPSTASPDPEGPTTSARYLLSCSADKTIRLWSLETWANVVVYKSHDSPVWDVKWGPSGHYFLTGSADWTARLWSTDHVEPHKLYVGHDNDVDCVAFHPNNLYVFTASCDKTVRMWHITSGSSLRLFTGHTSPITAIACSPDGHTLASADDSGSIILWDLQKGRRKKRMRGHGKGGIWSLSWSVESTVLVSGGADGTVRVWDAVQETVDGKVVAEGGAGAKIDAGTGAAGTATSKKSKTVKETVISADQISAFPTKKSPVYKVQFTRMNLVLAGGAYMP